MADISKIHLPSGDYDIKDTVARSIIGGAISFKISYDGSAAPNVAEVPQGVVIIHNGQSYTGTLTPVNAASNTFYLIKSTTTPSTEVLDIYDEYMVVKPVVETSSTWFWEKIGDTQVNISNLVTDVTLSKQTDTVIGTDATFTITQPTISLATDNTSGTGKVQVATGVSTDKTYIKGSANGGNVAWNSKDSTTVVTGYSNTSSGSFLNGATVSSGTLVLGSGNALTGLGTPTTDTVIGTDSTFTVTQPTISLATDSSSATGRVQVVTDASVNTIYIKGSASGANTAWNSKDSVTVLTNGTNVTVTKG